MGNHSRDMCSETGLEIPAEQGISEKETGGWSLGSIEKVKRWMDGWENEKMRR